MIKTLLKRTSWRDLLLPVGAAIVAAGVEYLSDRERTTRARLAELEQLVAEKRAELGILAPDDAERMDPEPEPIGSDPNSLAGSPVDPLAFLRDTDPETEHEPRRPWKLAALAVAAASAVVLLNWDELVQKRLFPELYRFNHRESTMELAEPFPSDAMADLLDRTAEQAYPAPVDVDPLQRAGEHEHEPDRDEASDDLCGWPNCDYVPTAKDSTARVTQLAVHRNGCIYRPAGAHVPGE